MLLCQVDFELIWARLQYTGRQAYVHQCLLWTVYTWDAMYCINRWS